MKNNRGFSTVELVTTFALTLVVVTVLLQLVVVLKELYVNNGIRNNLLTKQALISEKIKDDFRNYEVDRVTKVNSSWLKINYVNKGEVDLKVNGDLIEYDGNVFKLAEGTRIVQTKVSETDYEDISLSYRTVDYSNSTNVGINSYFVITIRINSDLVVGEYGVNLVYQYHSSNNNITFN